VNGDTWNLSIDYRPKEVKVGQEVEIYGRLTRNGIPVPDVDVTLFINGEAVKTKKTYKDGSYSFKVVFKEPGTYTVYTEAYPKGKPPVISKELATVLAIMTAATAVVGAVSYKPKEKR